MSLLHSTQLDLLHRVELRVDSICLDALGKGHLSADNHPLAAVRLDGGEDSMEGQSKHAPLGSLSTVCGALHRLSGRDAGLWLQELHQLSDTTEEAARGGEGE